MTTHRHPGQSRYSVAVAWCLGFTLLFILYETMLPFRFNWSAAQLAAGWERATLLPFRGPDGLVSARSDIVGNIALFVPFGLLLTLSSWLTRAGKHRLPWLVLGGLGLSLAIKSTQLFAPMRFAQTTDLITNTVGSGLGVLVALRPGRALFDAACDSFLAHLRHDPTPLIVLGLTTAALLGALLPLDLSLSKTWIRHSLRTLNLDLLTPFPPASGLAPWLALIKAAWLYLFWGAATAQLLRGRAYPLLWVLGWGGLLVLVSEASKLFVVSQDLTLIEPVVSWCTCGLGAALLLWGHQLGLTGRALGRCFAVGYLVYLIADTVSPLAPQVLQSLLHGIPPVLGPWRFQPIPFLAAPQLQTVTALGEWSARLVRFLPLGAAIHLVVARPARRWCAVITAAGAVLLLQLLVGAISPWPGDMTEVILAWAGLAGGWYIGGQLARQRQIAPTNQTEPGVEKT
ncbi:MAG: VanZ family protein [bacterium]